MHGIIAHQMRVGFNRAEIIQSDDLNIGASGFDDGAQNIAADPSKTINGNFYSHSNDPFPKGQ